MYMTWFVAPESVRARSTGNAVHLAGRALTTRVHLVGRLAQHVVGGVVPGDAIDDSGEVRVSGHWRRFRPSRDNGQGRVGMERGRRNTSTSRAVDPPCVAGGERGQRVGVVAHCVLRETIRPLEVMTGNWA